MRICDFCGQEIQDEAVYCRFCERELGANPDLAGRRRCPTCAEWVERGAIICPFCDHSLGTDPVLGKPSRLQRLAAEPKPYDPREVLEPKPAAERPFFRRPAEVEPEPDLAPDDDFGGSEETSGMFPPVRAGAPFSAKPPDQGPAPGRGEVAKRPFWAKKPAETAFNPPDPFAAAPAEPAAGIFGALREPAPVPTPPRRWTAYILPLVGIVAIAALVIVFGPRLIGGGGDLAQGLAGLLEPGEPEPGQVTPLPIGGETATPLVVATVPAVTTTPAAGTDCRSWDTVTLDDVGRELCVYGEVRRRFAQGEIPFVAIFSEETGSFIVIDRTQWHDIWLGACIQATGVVEAMRLTRPVIDIQGSLQLCP